LNANVFFTQADAEAFIVNFGALIKNKYVFDPFYTIRGFEKIYFCSHKNILNFFFKKRRRIIFNLKNIKFYKFRSKFFQFKNAPTWVPSAA